MKVKHPTSRIENKAGNRPHNNFTVTLVFFHVGSEVFFDPHEAGSDWSDSKVVFTSPGFPALFLQKLLDSDV